MEYQCGGENYALLCCTCTMAALLARKLFYFGGIFLIVGRTITCLCKIIHMRREQGWQHYQHNYRSCRHYFCCSCFVQSTRRFHHCYDVTDCNIDNSCNCGASQLVPLLCWRYRTLIRRHTIPSSFRLSTSSHLLLLPDYYYQVQVLRSLE